MKITKINTALYCSACYLNATHQIETKFGSNLPLCKGHLLELSGQLDQLIHKGE